MLKTHKLKSNLSIRQIAMTLDIPKTKAEHWFRNDNCFSIPEPELWFSLKEMLKIETNLFDSQVTEFIEKEGVFEKSGRVYDEEGLAPTLTTSTEEKIIVRNK